MDNWILIAGFVPFILLIVTLPLVFRKVHAYDAISWFVRLSVFFSLFCLGIWWVGNIAVVSSLVIYGLLVLLFLFGIFGIFEASITLHILKIIFLSGPTGIHPNAILSTYNRNSIVKKRIDRMIYSRELVIVGKQYRLVKNFSNLMLREYLLKLLRFLYP